MIGLGLGVCLQIQYGYTLFQLPQRCPDPSAHPDKMVEVVDELVGH